MRLSRQARVAGLLVNAALMGMCVMSSEASAAEQSIPLGEVVEVEEGQRQGDGTVYWASGDLSLDLQIPGGGDFILVVDLSVNGYTFWQLEWAVDPAGSAQAIARSIDGEVVYPAETREFHFENPLQAGLFSAPGRYEVELGWTAHGTSARVTGAALNSFDVSERDLPENEFAIGVDVDSDVLTVGRASTLRLSYFGVSECPHVTAQLIAGDAIIESVQCEGRTTTSTRTTGTFTIVPSTTERVHINLSAVDSENDANRAIAAFSIGVEPRQSFGQRFGFQMAGLGLGLLFLLAAWGLARRGSRP